MDLRHKAIAQSEMHSTDKAFVQFQLTLLFPSGGRKLFV